MDDDWYRGRYKKNPLMKGFLDVMKHSYPKEIYHIPKTVLDRHIPDINIQRDITCQFVVSDPNEAGERNVIKTVPYHEYDDHASFTTEMHEPKKRNFKGDGDAPHTIVKSRRTDVRRPYS